MAKRDEAKEKETMAKKKKLVQKAKAPESPTFCFHHNDLDGQAAAAIVHRHNGAQCVAVDYKDPFPFGKLDKDKPSDVWVVDFSLNQEEGAWDKLLKLAHSVTWIDHHQTAIQAVEDVARIRDLPGIRNEGVLAACELTWAYLHHGLPAPPAIAMIGDYDTYTFRHGEATKNLKVGLEAQYDTRPMEGIGVWKALMDPGDKPFVRSIREVGARIRAKLEVTDADTLLRWGHDVNIGIGHDDLGPYQCLALNTQRSGSVLFASAASGYHLHLPYAFDGQTWTVGVYRGSAGQDIDCSDIAKQFGGGGHPGAAGFSCETLPWG